MKKPKKEDFEIQANVECSGWMYLPSPFGGDYLNRYYDHGSWQKAMEKWKMVSQRPKGSYCYVPDAEKNADKDENDSSYYIKTCPFWGYKKDGDVDICHCSFLNEKSIPNDISDKDYVKLEKKYGEGELLCKHFTLDLLWDQVKECGENYNHD